MILLKQNNFKVVQNRAILQTRLGNNTSYGKSQFRYSCILKTYGLWHGIVLCQQLCHAKLYSHICVFSIFTLFYSFIFTIFMTNVFVIHNRMITENSLCACMLF